MCGKEKVMNKKMNVLEKAKKVTMNAVVKASKPQPSVWPWCVGIIHQPKHPMVQKQDEK